MFSNSKGATLQYISDKLVKFVIPEFILISSCEWNENPNSQLNIIENVFGNRSLAIRSSAADEDGIFKSRAGEYESVLNIKADDRAELKAAIFAVINSYEQLGAGSSSQKFIVQEMVNDIALSGVIFTHELNTGAPYYVINYDDVSGLTNTVTSGDGEHANRTLYIHRSSAGDLRSERFHRLIVAVQELEKLLGNHYLDIEFALDKALQPYLLQVRSITTRPNWNRAVVRRIDSELLGIRSFVSERFRPLQGVYGSSTVLGQMPDWNPAEMIGRAPRALSFSLYRRLITDDAWRMARETMGYAVPSGQPLMVSLAGQPFIDTRLSFHSYLPASLSPAISCKLVDEWIERLRDKPELHDKIEFDVAITTFSFDLDERMDRLASCLDVTERSSFREALLGLTQPLLQGQGEGSITAALARIDRLAALDLPASSSGPMGLQTLIEQCVRYGTVPFSILARHGFIARTLLLSLMRRGALDENAVACLQGGVRTVAGEFLQQIHALQCGELSRADFMKRYGHLRPGTYDICSPRYDQMDSFGSASTASKMAYDEPQPFQLSAQQRKDIDTLLREAPLPGVASDVLISYLSAAIAGREYGKFVFTRSVSAMLELIASFGEGHGLSREEMSHVPLQAILEIGVESGGGRSVEVRLRQIAEENAERHALTTAIRLPQVLFDEAGVHIVPFQVSQPNFITSLKINADAIYLSQHHPIPNLKGRIVLIENADPGYDWIFAQSIAGLVTKYGGANSHMAIRCAEFGIPAAIGCGEQRFEALIKAIRLSLDCAVGTVMPVH